MRRKFVKNANELGQKISPKKSQKFDTLVTPKQRRVAPSYIRSVLCKFASSFQRIKNISDWSPHEGENLV